MEAHEFYSKAKDEYYSWINSMKDYLMKALLVGAISDENFLSKIQSKIKEKENLDVIKHMGKIPPEYFKNFSSKMRDTFVKYGKMAFRCDYLLNMALRELEKNSLLMELNEIQKLEIPERIKNYLVESRKCYTIGAYDSSIVLCGRAAEFALKDYFNLKKINYNEKGMLLDLMKTFKKVISGEKVDPSDRIMENLSEVVRLYRNITAHDNPTRSSQKDADLVWSSTKVIVDRLIKSNNT